MHDWLVGEGVSVPSARTCHKILSNHGRTRTPPSKRPKSSYRGFELMRPNGVWQLDGHGVELVEGSAVVLRFQDDHSRMLMGSRAAPGDNGASFTARLRHGGGYARVTPDGILL